MFLPVEDPRRITPSRSTDEHALPVLIYEYLLKRHPISGPKFHSQDPQEDDFFLFGPKALYIEHPTDTSNRPKNLNWPVESTLGSHLSELFKRSFVHGLHSPGKRPSSGEWEKGLLKTWDLLYPCSNAACTHKWFVFTHKIKACPFCGSAPAHVGGIVPILKLRSANGSVDAVTAYNGKKLYRWHAYSDVLNNENTTEADRTHPSAEIFIDRGKWFLRNLSLPRMFSPAKNPVPIGSAVELATGAAFRFSDEPSGRKIEVEWVKV